MIVATPPPPPVIAQPAAYQVSYGMVRGTAARGATRVIVKVDGFVRADVALRGRSFTIDLDLPPGQRTIRIETADGDGRRAATTIPHVTGLPRAARPRDLPARLDSGMQRELERLVRRFGPTAGVYVQSLTTGAGAAWNARATFPGASTLKLAIAVTALSRLDGPPAHGSRLDGLFREMLIVSDNEAANRIEEIYGGSTSGGSRLVNDVMRSIGLERTEMWGGYLIEQSLEPGRDLAGGAIPLRVDDQADWGTGKTTTPYDLARIARAVWLASGGLGPLREAQRGFTPMEARYLLALLAEVRDPGKLEREIGRIQGVRVLHKAGWLEHARHDNGLVFWHGGVFVATVMTYRPHGADASSDVLAGEVAAAMLRRVRG
ncbi:MAG: hypothetical protein EXQ81_07580 [Thermoleophilia bacterium]|nr:hypothetical protein [Thermoleophilia bacterium]